MTEEQNEKLHELYEKYYIKCIPLTYDEKIQLMELENIKRHDLSRSELLNMITFF